jgi:hypothetical protein
LDKAAVEETLEALSVAVRTASDVATAYNDPVKLAEIARAEAAAAAAAKKFDAVTGA